MAQTIEQQQPIINRASRFIAKYGLSKTWLAERTQIKRQRFSLFLNARFALSGGQLERLIDFMDEYDRRMVGFMALEK